MDPDGRSEPRCERRTILHRGALRALVYDITANTLGFSAGDDWHESTGLAANVSALDFSDGNRRGAGGFRFVQRLGWTGLISTSPPVPKFTLPAIQKLPIRPISIRPGISLFTAVRMPTTPYGAATSAVSVSGSAPARGATGNKAMAPADRQRDLRADLSVQFGHRSALWRHI